MKVLPKNTNVSSYFEYKDYIFETMKIPDGRSLVQVVHTWGDGEIMKFGFEYQDGISRKGINPLHIVKIYDNEVSRSQFENDLDEFLERYKGDIQTMGVDQ